MIKYRARWEKIEPIEVEKETDKCVFIRNGNRLDKSLKHTSWECYLDTWEDAHEHIIAGLEGQLRQAQSTYDQIKHKLSIVHQMVKP